MSAHSDRSAVVDAERPVKVCVTISSDSDLILARREGRTLAQSLGFTATEATLVATAISELARNILHYATCGEITIAADAGESRVGITVIARDSGPGIADLRLALQSGYSSADGLGLGLPGVRRIMDEFDIASTSGLGTTVTVTKWKSA